MCCVSDKIYDQDEFSFASIILFYIKTIIRKVLVLDCCAKVNSMTGFSTFLFLKIILELTRIFYNIMMVGFEDIGLCSKTSRQL